MKTLVRLALALALLLAGCQKQFAIIVTDLDQEAPLFRLEPRPGAVGVGEEIDGLQVARVVSKGKPMETVWLIETSSGQPQRMKLIRYGRLPEGFRELRAAAALRRGERYTVISGMRGKLGGADFTLTENPAP